MTSRCDVFCVGNAVVDVLVKPVEKFPPAGATQRVERTALAPGGNGVNTAIALARLGMSVQIAAAVGKDSLGRFMREAIQREHIEDSNLVAVEGANTSVTVALVQSDGEHRFLHYLGANGFFSPSHLDWSLVRGARVFHYASAFALPAFDGAGLDQAMSRAKQLGCLTSLNTCWDSGGRWLSLLRPALAHADLIFPNLDEGRQLTGEKEPQAIAASLRRHGVKTVVLKMGPDGCYVDGPEGSFVSPGFAVMSVDTTGAGDCFAAAFLSAICAGLPLEEAARFANAAGALSTLTMGGSDAAPTRLQILEFLGERDHASAKKL